jgi:hypothetical protein
MDTLETSFKRLESYVVTEEFKGYDPYDTLNSFWPFKILGKWGPVLATQFQKRNPVNIRPLMGIKKEINPKGFSIFLMAYSELYTKTNDKKYLDKAEYFFNWLSTNYSKGYSGKCWGYNFPWATPVKYMQPWVPSAVVTGHVVKGLFEFYKVTKRKDVLELMESAGLFLDNDLEKYTDESGLSISYTPIKKDVCYNASLLAAESLAKIAYLNGNEKYKATAIKAVEFVLSRQKEDGRWNYSWNIETGKEQKQVDFHQGYILESTFEIKNLLNIKEAKWENAIQKGLQFYITQQFDPSGRGFWRLPKIYPAEIHNQAQGIITLVKLREYDTTAEKFARTIAEYTVQNMQGKDGHFYYQKFTTHTNKISYMRWSQSWMFLALTDILYYNK